MKTVAVILSGCGNLDGSEIHESVLTLLALDKAGAKVHCFAPNITQTKVMNFLTGEEVTGASRNVLEESARIARGEIKDVKEANAVDFDALIFPGGFGAALNLSNFAIKGSGATVNPDVLHFAKSMVAANKPLGFICIAPAMIPVICGKGIEMTIGNDPETVQVLTEMGCIHVDCPTTEYVVDKKHKIVSTPAYMLGPNIAAVAQGIEGLVNEVLAMA